MPRPTRVECFNAINESNPRIGKAIKELWGSQYFQEFMDSLLIDDRHDRQGFPPNMLRHLINLQAYHDHDFPNFKKQPTDIWSLNL